MDEMDREYRKTATPIKKKFTILVIKEIQVKLQPCIAFHFRLRKKKTKTRKRRRMVT